MRNEDTENMIQFNHISTLKLKCILGPGFYHIIIHKTPLMIT